MFIKQLKEGTQIKMTLYNIPNMTEGFDDYLIGTVAEVSMFPPMFLVFVFSTVFLSGFSAQKRRTGFGDAPFWALISSVSTLFIALVMTLKSGLIDPLITFPVVIGITLICGIWFFFDQNRREV